MSTRRDARDVNHVSCTNHRSSPLDFTALVGGDVDKPRVASALRPDKEWIEFQQRKVFKDQAPLVEVLPRLRSGDFVDAVVVGAGPAGLVVAAEMASRGITVGLVAPDTPFVNNYGVWLEEFDELGLRDCLLREVRISQPESRHTVCRLAVRTLFAHTSPKTDLTLCFTYLSTTTRSFGSTTPTPRAESVWAGRTARCAAGVYARSC